MICLETTDRQGSLALFDGSDTIDLRELRGSQRTAQSFAPAMREMVEAADWTFDSIERVAVAAGPGSFTGLRIGVTAAKLLAYLCPAELVAVNTLEVIARQCFQRDAATKPRGPLWTVFDAQRSQLFAAKFEQDAESPRGYRCVDATRVMEIEDWLAILSDGDSVAGPVLSKLADELPAGVAVVNATCGSPTARGVGQVALLEFAAGNQVDPFQLVPQYYRMSAAEEKRAGELAE